VWRELDRDAMVVSIARNEHSLAVLFEPRGDQQLELWRWDLPDLTLRRRGRWMSRDVPGQRTLTPSGGQCDGVVDGDAWYVPGQECLEIYTKAGLAARTTAALHEIRWHAGLVTLIDQDSRVMALDVATGEQVTAFALRVH